MAGLSVKVRIGIGVGELLVGEEGVEEVVLDVTAQERLAVGFFDGL